MYDHSFYQRAQLWHPTHDLPITLSRIEPDTTPTRTRKVPPPKNANALNPKLPIAGNALLMCH